MTFDDYKKILNYDLLVDQALKTVVIKVLKELSVNKNLGDHHFFITFDTKHKSVEIPENFLKEHPENMTIVLQHQFWDLKVNNDSFSVTLSFNGNNKNLKIGFDAITQFSDPSTDFALQFASFNSKKDTIQPNKNEELGAGSQSKIQSEDLRDADIDKVKKEKSKSKKAGEIISLDNFRKR